MQERSKARRGLTRSHLMPGEVTPGCMGTAGGRCLRSSGSLSRATPLAHAHTTQQALGKDERRTAVGMAADNDASSLTRRGCRTRRSRTGSRCRRNAGESRLPRSSPLLCACRQHAGNQHWSHRSPPGGAGAIACASCMVGQTQNARGRAHERRWDEVWRVGMGWAARTAKA